MKKRLLVFLLIFLFPLMAWGQGAYYVPSQAAPGEMGGTTPFRIHLTDFYLESADVAHGITSILETNQFAGAFIASALTGGVDFYGISDANQDGALRLTGIIGATDPTDTYAATIFRGGKKNGTGWQALGAAETVFRFYNYTTGIGTAYGNGEWILTSLQNTPIGTSIAAAGNFTTGNFTGQVDIKATTTSHGATEAATAATMYGNVHKITGAYVVTLPAAVVGMSASFRASSAAVFSVDTNGADHFETYEGTALDAGDKLTSSGVKNEWIDIYCESANTWIVRRQNGVIIDGGA